MLMSPEETLTFSLSWPLLGKAAVLTLSTRESSESEFCVSAQVNTQGLARTLYPLNAYSKAFYLKDTKQLISLELSLDSPKLRYEACSRFDYTNHTFSHKSNRTHIIQKIPNSLIFDLSTFIVPIRSFPSQIGATMSFTVFLEGSFYPITLCSLKRQRIKTPLCSRDAILFQVKPNPLLENILKNGSDTKIWLSDDSDYLPLAFEIHLKHGTVKGTLVDIR